MNHVLEPAAQAFADATAQPPFLYEIGPEAARAVLDDVQSQPIDLPEVHEAWTTVPAEVGDVRVRIVTPPAATTPLPAVLYVHGGGWVLGNAGTHDRLVRELALGADVAVVFVEYDRSPEARYPVAVEQAYAAARWITTDGASFVNNTGVDTLCCARAQGLPNVVVVMSGLSAIPAKQRSAASKHDTAVHNICC